MEEGDLIFVPSGISHLTGHIGILAKDKDNNLVVCEAEKSSGVQFRTIKEFVNDPDYREVYTFNVDVEDSKKKEAASYASARIGELYNLGSNQWSNLWCNPYNEDNHEWYCSKLVYMAYLSSGVKLNFKLLLSLILPTSLVDPQVNPFVPTPPKMVLSKFGYNAGWRVEKNPRFVADVTGNNYPDIVGFADDGVHISFNKGNGTFQNPAKLINDFSYNAGWRVEKHPRFLADMDKRSLLDIVGFGYDGVFIASNNGNKTFTNPKIVINDFGYNAGWRVEKHPRFLADMTGDGRLDIAGFKDDGVYISINNGGGSFKGPVKVINDFGYNAGWRVEKHPRFLADMTGDGRQDILGFGDDGVYISINNGDGSFGNAVKVLSNFGYSAGGWRVEKHPRFLADMTGDGRQDIVGFGDDGVYISINNGDGSFQGPVKLLDDFSYNAGWRVENHLRFLADMRKASDGLLDIVGFGNDGVYISYNEGMGRFTKPIKVLSTFGYYDNAGGCRIEKHPRFLADTKGRSLLDIIGFGNDGVFVQYSSPRWEKQIKT